VPNKESLRQLDRYKIRVQEAREARMADLRTLSEQIAKLKDLTIQVRATEEGHLYGSVGAAEIAAALRGRNIHIDPAMVRMQGGIKEIGVYKVDLHLGYDIETNVTVAIAASQEK
jgi:large subunit ribosomal protein L9